jgi:hypothetical protein
MNMVFFAAYSLLGVSNRAYVQRADIDLGQLVGTSSVPTGSVSDNTLWLDTASTGWGILNGQVLHSHSQQKHH